MKNSSNKDNINDDLFVLAKDKNNEIEDIQGTSLSFWKDAKNRFFKNKASLVSLIILVLILFTSIIGPFLGGYNLNTEDDYAFEYNGSSYNKDFEKLPPRVPVLENIGIFNGYRDGVDMYEQAGAKEYHFLFGTDNFGRDLFVRVCLGTLISLSFGLIAALIDIVVGVSLGGISGYFGGKVDLFLQRVVEILGTVPTLIWVMIFVIYFGAGFFPLVFSIVISGWIPMYRLVRGQVFKLKEQEFVLSAQTLGTSGKTIIFKHILPNTIGTIIIWLMFTIPSAIFLESFLSFIGLGIAIPTPSLGSLASDGKEFINTYLYILLYPTITLSVIMLTFNLIADGLRDAFDPKLRGGE